MKYIAFSEAMGSNWFFYGPDNLLFDCGEGVCHFLKRKIFAIDKVFITHGHMDHTAGLFRLICSRAHIKGQQSDTGKPLDIYYPAGEPLVEKYIAFIDSLGLKMDYRLTWKPIGAGETIALPSGRAVETFATRHMEWQSCGYKVCETRKKLKDEYRGFSPVELQAVKAEKGDADLYDERLAILFCYPGDTMPLDPKVYEGAEVLVHEATFLDPGDRRGEIHSTLEEAVEIAAAAGVRRLILNHFSKRYEDFDEIRAAIREMAEAHSMEIDAMFSDRVFTEK